MLAAWRKGVVALRGQRFFVVTFGLSLLCIVLAVAYMWWKLFPDVRLAQVVPLHYNIHFGIDRTGSWWELFVPVALALVVTVANYCTAAVLWQRERVLAYAFAVTALFFDIIVMVATILVVLLNLVYA